MQAASRRARIVRAIARYLRQAAIGFSDAYMERTLIANPETTRLLVRFFQARFDPDRQDEAGAARLSEELVPLYREVARRRP